MPERYSPKDVRGLWEDTRRQFSESRHNIAEVRRWLGNKVEPEVPADFQAAINMAVKLPIPITVTSHTLQLLSRKRPLYRRIPLGEGIAPRKRSTKLEFWANALPVELEKQGGPLWRPWLETLFSYAEGALLCYPQMVHWEQFPGYLGEDDEPLPRYRRDAKDRDPEDEYFSEPGKRRAPFKLDGDRTKAAYEAYRTDFKARRIPLVARVVTPDQCLPLFGPNYRLDGLLVYSEYSEYALEEKGYRWIGGDYAIGPGQSADGSGMSSMTRMCGLYELWRPGKVCYYVGKRAEALYADETEKDPKKQKVLGYRAGEMFDTFKKVGDGGDDLNVAEVDLKAEYGYDKLPAYYGYGAHFAAEADPDRRGIPFLFPFFGPMHGANSVATAKVITVWNRAFGPDYIEADAALAEAAPELILEDGKPRKLPKHPNTASVIGGRLVHGYDTGVSNDVDEVIGLLLGAVQEQQPNPASFGGAGAASGHDRSLIRSFLEDAYNDVLDGGRLGWEWLGESALEWGTCIAEKTGHAVPIYVSQNAKGERREHIELTKDMADGVYDLDAYYPSELGENLPLSQLMMDWVERNKIPLRMALEQGLGVENPEEIMIEIEVENLLKTDQGRSLLLTYAANESEDEAMAELERMFADGLITKDGTPTQAMEGMEHLQGTTVPNAVDSAIGGIMSGAMEAGPTTNDQIAAMAA